MLTGRRPTPSPSASGWLGSARQLWKPQPVLLRRGGVQLPSGWGLCTQPPMNCPAASAVTKRARAMPPCSPKPATPPLRTSVTALAATAFIGGYDVHSPHATARCTPPCRSPQRLPLREPGILFLSGSAEPSLASGRGEGLGRRPAKTLSDRGPLAEGGTVRRTAAAAAGPLRLSSHSLASPASWALAMVNGTLSRGTRRAPYRGMARPAAASVRGNSRNSREAASGVTRYTSAPAAGRGGHVPRSRKRHLGYPMSALRAARCEIPVKTAAIRHPGFRPSFSREHPAIQPPAPSTTTLLRAGPGPAIARRVQNSAACRLFGGVRAKMLKRRSRGIAKAATCCYLCRYVVASTGNSVVVLGAGLLLLLLLLLCLLRSGVPHRSPERARARARARAGGRGPGSAAGQG